VLWIAWNIVAEMLIFDDYPFVFLTLVLSLQASYAAPLILLAQNRQADRDRVAIEQDRQQAERNLADTEYLAREMAGLRIALGEVATRDFVRSELRNLLEELTPDSDRSDEDGHRRDDRGRRDSRARKDDRGRKEDRRKSGGSGPNVVKAAGTGKGSGASRVVRAEAVAPPADQAAEGPSAAPQLAEDQASADQAAAVQAPAVEAPPAPTTSGAGPAVG